MKITEDTRRRAPNLLYDRSARGADRVVAIFVGQLLPRSQSLWTLPTSRLPKSPQGAKAPPLFCTTIRNTNGSATNSPRPAAVLTGLMRITRIPRPPCRPALERTSFLNPSGRTVMSDTEAPSSSSLDRDPIEQLADSFITRFRAGERPSIEKYAAKHPEMAAWFNRWQLQVTPYRGLRTSCAGAPGVGCPHQLSCWSPAFRRNPDRTG